MPTDHQLEAALWQARLLDDGSSGGSDVHLAHRLTATEGRFPPRQLADALRLLAEVDLVTVNTDGAYTSTDALRVLSALDDESALSLLRRHCIGALGAASDIEEERALVGAVGEELVARQARFELRAAGRTDLANQVQRVSLVDDGLGYDVLAPTLDGRLRLLEVKASANADAAIFRFFISRNEYEVGRSNQRDWGLVACDVGSGRTVDDAALIGWAHVRVLKPYLPEDASGRWSEALVRLPRSALTPGLPPLV